MKLQISALQKQPEYSEEVPLSSDDVSKRYAQVESAEEALIERMNEYMEKEAELEQREENLFHLERKFYELQNSERNTA